MAQSERQRSRSGLRHGQRSQRARHGDLRNAWHADAGSGARLHDAGLDFYNHNVDTSPEFYDQIITTRTMQDRIDTLAHVREAGHESLLRRHRWHGRARRGSAWHAGAAGQPSRPSRERSDQSSGTRSRACRSTTRPSGRIRSRWSRMIAVARIMMPKSVVRLSAGRQYMTDELQALCFVAGANSIFIGDVLLTTKNPQTRPRRAVCWIASASNPA